MNSSVPPIMVANGCGNHTTKMSAAAMAPSTAVIEKWMPNAKNFRRQRFMRSSMRSVVETYPAPQSLVPLLARLGIQAPLLRSARGLGGVTFTGRDQCTPHEVQELLLGNAPVLLLAARLACHDQQFTRIVQPLTREDTEP